MKTHYTVFFSWQSDIKGNANIIRDELQAQAVYLKEKYGYNISIVDGTRDVAGMPPIEKVIMERINECDVFVCDITPVEEHEVSSSPNRIVKQMPNSSVLLELGFALRCMSYHRIIAVARKGSWQDYELPFDINHMRVGKFSKEDCSLRFELEASINHVATYGKTRSYDDLKFRRIRHYIRSIFYHSRPEAGLSGDVNLSSYPKATDSSVTAFARRTAEAFPGVRGLQWYVKKSDIRNCLRTFFHEPLHFTSSCHGYGDPIWWFRGGRAAHCNSFELLTGRRILINSDILKVKKIAIYRDPASYYREYIYLEAEPERSIGVNSIDKECVDEGVKQRGYYCEEYAEFRLLPFIAIPIREEEYDDGHTMKFGKIWTTRNRSTLRCRYLTSYNIVIAAKGSPYNTHSFDRESGEWLNGLLDGTRSYEGFHTFMMSLPRNKNEDPCV